MKKLALKEQEIAVRRTKVLKLDKEAVTAAEPDEAVPKQYDTDYWVNLRKQLGL